MTAEVIPIPSMSVAEARQIIAHPDMHDAATVLDACEFLRDRGDWMDRERAKALHAEIVRIAVSGINRAGRIRRWLLIVGDLLGTVALFGILYLLLIFTPG